MRNYTPGRVDASNPGGGSNRVAYFTGVSYASDRSRVSGLPPVQQQSPEDGDDRKDRQFGQPSSRP